MKNNFEDFRALELLWQKIIATKTQKLQTPRKKTITSSYEKQFRGLSCFKAFVAKKIATKTQKLQTPRMKIIRSISGYFKLSYI